jgi:hypothetical protein
MNPKPASLFSGNYIPTVFPRVAARSLISSRALVNNNLVQLKEYDPVAGRLDSYPTVWRRKIGGFHGNSGASRAVEQKNLPVILA